MGFAESRSSDQRPVVTRAGKLPTSQVDPIQAGNDRCLAASQCPLYDCLARGLELSLVENNRL